MTKQDRQQELQQQEDEEHQHLVQDAQYCYYLIRGLLELGSDEISEGKK